MLSLGARVWHLGQPTDDTGRGALIFDEKYYVNAARVLLHLPVPCHHTGGCDPYSGMPGGIDPNSEHPPLGKLFIAAGMKLFGDNPNGWRFFPLVFGTLAILGMYWLVRTAGGNRWLALGAASLLAVDNLSMLHGRIATLDVFVLVFMIAAVGLYLRGFPVVAGITLGIGACVKLVAPDVLLVLLLVELLRYLSRREWRGVAWWRPAGQRLVPLLYCSAVSVVVYLGVLDLLDVWVKPYHNPSDSCPGSGNTFSNSFVHTRFMLCYASKLTSPLGPTGIASYPWQWLLNQEAINYYRVDINVTIGSDKVTHPIVAFQGLMNPAIIFLALPALGLCLWEALRTRAEAALVAVAWFAGTYIPFVPASWFQQRTSYLYYMAIVMPGVCLAVAWLFSRRVLPRAALAGYVAILGYWFVALYPFRTWSGS